MDIVKAEIKKFRTKICCCCAQDALRIPDCFPRPIEATLTLKSSILQEPEERSKG